MYTGFKNLASIGTKNRNIYSSVNLKYDRQFPSTPFIITSKMKKGKNYKPVKHSNFTYLLID